MNNAGSSLRSKFSKRRKSDKSNARYCINRPCWRMLLSPASIIFGKTKISILKSATNRANRQLQYPWHFPTSENTPCCPSWVSHTIARFFSERLLAIHLKDSIERRADNSWCRRPKSIPSIAGGRVLHRKNDIRQFNAIPCASTRRSLRPAALS
jgi:hypothetical protein